MCHDVCILAKGFKMDLTFFKFDLLKCQQFFDGMTKVVLNINQAVR